ncbi:MAG TPA: hypothetical protein VHQ47_12810 [Phycisphaerae bacterium]|nr:hypothetical protein [Phycisphaerae bacterium]
MAAQRMLDRPLPRIVAGVALMLVYGILMLLTMAVAGSGTAPLQRGYDGRELLGMLVMMVGAFHVTRFLPRWWTFVLLGTAAAGFEGTLAAGPGLGDLALGGAITASEAQWMLGGIVTGVVLAAVLAGELGVWHWCRRPWAERGENARSRAVY